jgi:F0F1-type ATP synthase assembly protein I
LPVGVSERVPKIIRAKLHEVGGVPHMADAPKEHDDSGASANDPVERYRRERADRTTAGGWYAMAGVGFEFAAAILMLGGIGWWLDKQFGTRPWLMVVGFVLGFIVGLWLLLRAAGKVFRD